MALPGGGTPARPRRAQEDASQSARDPVPCTKPGHDPTAGLFLAPAKKQTCPSAGAGGPQLPRGPPRALPEPTGGTAELCLPLAPLPSGSGAVLRNSPAGGGRPPAPFHRGLHRSPRGRLVPQGTPRPWPASPGTGCEPGRRPRPRFSPRDGLTNFLSSIASCPFRLGGRLRKQSERGNRRRPRGSVPPGSAALPGGTGGCPLLPDPSPETSRPLRAQRHQAEGCSAPGPGVGGKRWGKPE